MPHFSASQVKNYSRCPRRWHLDKFSNYPTPPVGAGAVLGKKVHAEIERYLQGETLELSTITAPARDFLDWLRGRPALVIEQYFKRDGVIGYIDAYTKGIVIDHKTSSDPDLRALTPDQLANDLQMTIYANHCLSQDPSLEQITLAHAYYHTKRPAFKVVKIKVSREQIERQYKAAIDFIRKEMAPLATTSIDSFTVPARLSSCNAFGGCPFLSLCQAKTPTKGKNQMSNLSDLIAARKTTADVLPPEAPNRATPPIPDTEPPALPAAIDMQAAIAAVLAARPTNSNALGDIAKAAAGCARWTKNRTKDLTIASRGAIRVDGDAVIYQDTPAQASATPTNGLTLMLNCARIKGYPNAVTFADLVAPIIEQYPVDPQTLDYGKGIADVVSATTPPAAGVVMVDTNNPYWGRASQKWIATASVVIRGV